MYRIGLIGNRAHQNSYGPVWHEREDCKIVAAAEHHAKAKARHYLNSTALKSRETTTQYWKTQTWISSPSARTSISSAP